MENETSNAAEGVECMGRLVQIFETYKSSEYYNNSSIEINFDWLKDRLSLEELEELEKQVYGIILDNEEELFINCFKYAFELFQEVAMKKS